MADIKLTQNMFYAQYGLPPHRQKQARDKLKMKLSSAEIFGRRQKVYTDMTQIDRVLSACGFVRTHQGSKEIVAKIIRTNIIRNGN